MGVVDNGWLSTGGRGENTKDIRESKMLSMYLCYSQAVYRRLIYSPDDDPAFFSYTVLDSTLVVLVLFIGNHDDAAAYLCGKK